LATGTLRGKKSTTCCTYSCGRWAQSPFVSRSQGADSPPLLLVGAEGGSQHPVIWIRGREKSYTVKKRFAIFPSGRVLVSDIPAGDRKIVILFFPVYEHKLISKCCLFPVSAFFSFQNGAGYDTRQDNHEISFWAKVAENPNFSMDSKSDLRRSIFLSRRSEHEAQSLFW
jgi:hypothetical protein